MSAPKYIPHYTYADYVQWQGDWELWRGVPVAMSPSPRSSHQIWLLELGRRLLNALEASSGCRDCRVVGELDWIIADDLVVRPDLAVVCHDRLGEYITGPPSLVIELLSPATEQKDRTAKRALYQDQGVPHYLMMEPDQGQWQALMLTASGYVEQPLTHPLPLTLHEGCRIDLGLD